MLETDKEKEWLFAMAKGDELAFQELYNRYYPGVFQFALGFLENRQEAEDCTAETFIKLWDARSDTQAVKNISSFLFIAIRNACLNCLRNNKRHADHHERIKQLSSHPIESFRQNEITEHLLEFLESEVSKLSDQQRKVLQLHLEGFKNEEIGQLLAVSEKTIRNIKSEALKKLKIGLLEQDLFTLFLLYTLLLK